MDTLGRTLVFVAEPRHKGWPLRDFLRQNGVTAGLMKGVKYRGSGFFADGRPVFTDYLLQGTERISFELPPEKDTAVQPQDIPLIIAYEDEGTMVLEKPAGMAVHPSLTVKESTLANAWMGLLARRGQEGVFRPVNRLDRNTSGLVLCAKDAYAAPLLAGGCQKVYTAIVEGRMPLGPGVVEQPIGRAEDSIICRQVCPGGKPSRTEYTVLAAGEEFSLVQAVPVTGRTHQIRVHMAWLGHPLAGDDMYGSGKGMERHALHCSRVSFADEQGREHTVESPLPPDMEALARKSGLLE
ncbi:MAG: RluA family pseudouridine synthase [Oscillospiraceae bacterium]|nr:RluA family pseudouridine synthase [Oscillospiraceae bacterium]